MLEEILVCTRPHIHTRNHRVKASEFFNRETPYVYIFDCFLNFHFFLYEVIFMK